MYGHDRIPILLFHLIEGLVPQDPCIVDEYVHLAEGLDGGLGDVLTTLGSGYVVIVRNSLAAKSLDLIHNLVRRSIAMTHTVTAAPEVVHHDLGTPFRKLKGILPPQA